MSARPLGPFAPKTEQQSLVKASRLPQTKTTPSPTSDRTPSPMSHTLGAAQFEQAPHSPGRTPIPARPSPHQPTLPLAGHLGVKAFSTRPRPTPYPMGKDAPAALEAEADSHALSKDFRANRRSTDLTKRSLRQERRELQWDSDGDEQDFHADSSRRKNRFER